MDSVKNYFNHLVTLYSILLVIACIPLFFIKKGDVVLLINQTHSQFQDLIFQYITYLGHGFFLFPLLMLSLKFKDNFNSIVIVLVSIFHGLIMLILKETLFGNNPRPKAFFGNTSMLHFVDGVEVYSSRSFPSGHTATAFVIAFCISLLYQRHLVSYIFSFAAVLVAYSRIYLLQHFYVDIVFGALVGVVSVLVSRFIVTLYVNKQIH